MCEKVYLTPDASSTGTPVNKITRINYICNANGLNHFPWVKGNKNVDSRADTKLITATSHNSDYI